MQIGKTNKKQTFLGGAATLALATAIVKVIGAVYKIPLNLLLGKKGFGYFNTAYDIYSVLLMISTAGLPVAMSRMISEARTLGRTRQIRQIYRTAFLVFVALGATGSLGMLLLCKQLAGIMSQAESWYSIACLSPAVLFICLISSDRGFFQGQGNMMPTSVSQVMEALCKLVVGLLAAYLLKSITNSMTYAAGGAILGVTASTLLSVIYLSVRRRRAMRELENEPCEDEIVFSGRQTARTLLTIAVPITLGAAGLQIITTVDTAVYMARLQGAAGFTSEAADDLKGIYNFAQTIFNMPCAFITPLTISVIPALTEQLTLRRRRAANTVAESAARVMGLVAMPCSVGLVVLAEPIMQLLGKYSGEDLALAATLIRILGLCVLFNSFVLVLNAIMQAHGYVYIPVLNMVVGGVCRVLITLILVGNPAVHIKGAAISTLCCYAIITALDLFSLRRVLRRPPRLASNLYKPAAAALLMGVGTWGVHRLLSNWELPLLIRVVGSVSAAVVLYAALVYLLRIITMDDCKLLPKGDKIAKILRIS